MSTLIKNGCGISSLIKSVQRGTISMPSNTTTATVTITAVTTSNSVLRTSVYVDPAGSVYANNLTATGAFASTTSLLFTRASATAGETLTIYWEVIEFRKVKSIQRGETTSTGNITVTSVDTANCMLFVTMRFTSSGNYASYMQFAYSIVSSTTINIASLAGGTFVWQLVEFY